MVKGKSGVIRRDWRWLLTRLSLLIAAVTVSCLSSRAAQQSQVAGGGKGQFDCLVKDYFAYAFAKNPTWATEVGVHTYDSALEDFTEPSVVQNIQADRRFLKSLEAIDAGELNAVSALDYPLLKSHLLADLLELEQVAMWRRNPDFYSSLASSSVYALIKRDFAPLSQRLKLVIARERQIPELLLAGRKNMTNPPAVYTQVALEQIPGIIDFFAQSVPAAFSTVGDEKLKGELAAVNGQVLASLESYRQFLKEDLSLRSTGSFAIGSELFAKKLLYDEMVDEPLDQLLARGQAELTRLQNRFVETAHKINPSLPAADVFRLLAADHPQPSELIASTQDVLEMIRSFCIDKKICSIPSEKRVQVEETPPFERALTFASMDTPGPMEEKATEAYYHVTLPDPHWSKEKIEEHMRAFSRLDLINTSVHEAYPGHYVQFLWLKQAPSLVRMLIGSNTNCEGWAHYCEEMMLDEQLGGADNKLRLVQLHDALLRVCRYLVGIRMHTAGMTVDQGVNFFMKEGWQEKANAERETKRGTFDPTYLYYTLGKMEILSLRADYQQSRGGKFTLKEFHDQFLAQGYPPLKIVRAALLGVSR